MPNRSALIGLDMPDDFPIREYEAIKPSTIAYGEMNKADMRIVGACLEWATAWNAVARRFFSLDRYDTRFRSSIRKFPISPPPEERQQQEEDLFNFFVTAPAVIDALCYATFSIGSMLQPDVLALQAREHKQAVTPGTTAIRFNLAFPGDPTSLFLQASFPGKKVAASLPSSSDGRRYFDLGEVRNQLAHRGAPPRSHHVQIRGRLARYGSPATIEQSLLWMGQELNEQATASWRHWLAAFVCTFMQEVYRFVGRHIAII